MNFAHCYELMVLCVSNIQPALSAFAHIHILLMKLLFMNMQQSWLETYRVRLVNT